jgi:alpha-glucoside transport system permease protein
VEKLLTTFLGVVGSVGISAILFIGANKIFDLAPRHWKWFSALIGFLSSATVFLILWSNNLLLSPRAVTIGAIAIGTVGGFALGMTSNRLLRFGYGAGAGMALGALAGAYSQNVFGVLEDGTPVLWPARPNLLIGPLLAWTVGGVAVGLAIWYLNSREKPAYRSALMWGTLGWAVGAYLIPSLSSGTQADAIIAGTVLGFGVGGLPGSRPLADAGERNRVKEESRKYIFLGPAFLFIAVTLIIPTIRTLILSVRDRRGDGFVGSDNYKAVFADSNTFDTSDWRLFFTSRLFWIGAVIVVVGFIIARRRGREIGTKLEGSPPSYATWFVGGLLLSAAALSVLRGTLFNNLWWVITVTLVATALGLGIAVLADRAKYESAAKSIIFLPMAISFVGAGIIWRFMFQARQPTADVPHGGQTGLLNALWVGLGELSDSTWPKLIALAIVAAIAVGLGVLAYKAFKDKAMGIFMSSTVALIPVVWFFYSLIVGIGGWADGRGEIILFIQNSPFNNLWLMLVLIWTQVGFTMIIFSAAIKAVPAELLEAAKVDGATESQSFWKITIPQIVPTIGVVVTTLIVLVMKVFDIVKVMTNGNFDTQVIANEMWQRAFTELNFGLGSALAVVLFLAVLPVIVLNVRRMQKAV